MMSEIQTLVEKVTKELAYRHAKIIEDECRAVCNNYKCSPDQLILEFKFDTEVHIKIDATKFQIKKIFTFDEKPINQ